MSNINIQSQTLGNNYNKIIDTTFKTFIKPNIEINPVISIDKFFENYNELFYQIPKEGSTNSHLYILNKTLEYLDLKLENDESIQALLDEITNLRKQLLDDTQILSELNKA